MAAFIITRDYVAEGSEKATGLIGPAMATERDVERLKAGEGTKFRMLDDDGRVYYHGRRLDGSECEEQYEDFYGEPEFSPLDCFGRPNAGCTDIQEKDENGKWQSI